MDTAVAIVNGTFAGEPEPERASTVQAAATRRTLLAYGGLAMPICLAGIPMVNFLPAFYAQELHLNAGLVGLVFFLARLWDGLSDPLVGWLSDRSMSRFGRRKPWVLFGAPFLMGSTWFLCNPPPVAGLAYLAVWAALFYTSWTVIYVPYLSWGSEVSTDYVERSRVTLYREAFTILGTLIFAVMPLVTLSDDAPLRDVLFLIAFSVMWMVPLAILPLGFLVKDSAPTQRTDTRLFKGIASLTKDRAFVCFVAATILIWTGEGVVNSLLLFAFRVGLQLSNNQFYWVILIIWTASLCGLPLTLYLSKRVEKHWLLAGGRVIMAIGFGAQLWVPKGNFPIVAAVWSVIGLAQVPALVLPTSILADIIDYDELNEGERNSGCYVAIFNLSMKIGLALGVGLSFGLLAIVQYVPGAEYFSEADSSNICMLAFGLSSVLMVLGATLLLKHPITREMQRRFRERIESRIAINTPASDS